MTLAEEAQVYLAVVDVFRAEGCEPQWRPEPELQPIARSQPAEQRPAANDNRRRTKC
jgi:hypothetical protein